MLPSNETASTPVAPLPSGPANDSSPVMGRLVWGLAHGVPMRVTDPVSPEHDGPSGPSTQVPDWSEEPSLPLPASAT